MDEMITCLILLKSIEILLLAVSSLSCHIEPEEGSLAGGTWITLIFEGLESGLLYPANGSQLEIHLVNVAVPALPSIPCDVSPVFLDLPVVRCRTRPLLSEAYEGLYYLEVHSGGQVVGNAIPGPQDSCTFKSIDLGSSRRQMGHSLLSCKQTDGKLLRYSGRPRTWDTAVPCGRQLYWLPEC